MLAINRIAYRRRNNAGLRRRGPQTFTRRRFVSDQVFVRVALENQVSGCRQNATVMQGRLRGTPHFLLRYGVPSEQMTLKVRAELQRKFVHLSYRIPEIHAQIEAQVPRREVALQFVNERRLLCRDIDETGVRAVRHRLPVVRAERPGCNFHCSTDIVIARTRCFNGAPRLHIDVSRPVDRHDIFCG